MSRIYFSLRMLLIACVLASASYAQTAIYGNAINGRVVDAATSAPLSGVRVYWGPCKALNCSAHQYVVTNLEGRFRIENREPGFYYLIAAAGDYGRQEIDVRLPLSAVVSVVFRLQKGGPGQMGLLAGKVLNAQTHAPIAGAWVGFRVTESTGRFTTTTTNLEGRFTSPPVLIGEHQVRCEAKGFAAAEAFAIVRDSTTTLVNLNLQPIVTPTYGSIVGKVTDANTSAPLSGARVVVQLSSTNTITTETRTNLNGEYHFYHIRSGIVRVSAAKDGYNPAVRENVTVPAGGSVRVDFTLIPKVLTGSISGVLKAAFTEMPLAGVRVYYYNTATSVTQPYVTTDAYGKFKILSLAPGPYQLAAETAGYPRQVMNVNVVGGQVTEVRFILYPEGHYGTLSGTVKNATTKAPIAGARVYYRLAGTTAPWTCVITDLEGRYTVPKIRVGEYRLTAEAQGYVAASGNVTIVENTTSGIDFELQPFATAKGSLMGKVLDAKTSAPLAGARVVVQRCNIPTPGAACTATTTETRTNENGEFAFIQIPAGQVNVIAFKDGYVSNMRTAFVPPDGVAQITLRLYPKPPTGRVVGNVRTAVGEQPIAGALVRLAPVNATAFAIVQPPDFARETLTDANGHYVFENVPVGSYTVMAAKSGFRQQGKPAVVLAGAVTEVNFLLAALPVIEYGRLAGRVVDAVTSRPLALAWVAVQLQVTESLGATPTRLVAYTNQFGVYEFPKVPVGSWAVYAARKGYMPLALPATIVKDQLAKLDFRLQPIVNPGVIEGTVADTSGTALANVHVIVPLIDLPHVANSNTALHGITNAEGRYVIGGVPAGERKATAFNREYIPKTQTVTVIANTTSTLDFVLDKRTSSTTQTIVVTAISARTGAKLEGVQVGVPVCDLIEPFGEWDLFQAVTGPDGTATLSGIPLGQFFVAGSLLNYQPGFAPLPGAGGYPTIAEGSGGVTLIMQPASARNAARGWTQY
ncbi:carboxypeptidase regulatory-like domain-containing protein [bacterium]|nr:carboxypeptidase regulatory-like domain-containing protein [bacterium]